MILNGAIDIKFNGADVKKIYLGRDTVWTREAHLIVTQRLYGYKGVMVLKRM